MQQRELWTSETKSKTIIEVDVSSLSISEYNPRKQREADYVQRLADRISANGYEITRAMWAYRAGDGYKVFAGGTRLQAARAAKLETVPIVLHTGFTDDEIVHLADDDNENDEYHEPVGLVDMWLSYKALADTPGWTQERIGRAKGCSQTYVNFRVRLAELPLSVLEIITTHSVNERQARELLNLLPGNNLVPWLTYEMALLEIVNWISLGHTTAKQTHDKVQQWKKFIALAEKIHDEFEDTITLYDLSGDEPQPIEYHPRDEFVKFLAESTARSAAAVRRAKGRIDIHISNNLNDYKVWVDARTAESARAAIRAREEEKLLSKIHLGDYKDVLAKLPDESVDLIFTDPPYDEGHIPDYGELAKIAARILKPKGSLVVYAGHYALPRLFELMCPHLDYWWQLIVKHSGAAARLPGKWVFVHYKPLLWFTKNGRRDDRYVSDFIHSEPTQKEYHKWEQDVSEVAYCIERLTDEGDLVVDPFCGSGTTGIAALELRRDFVLSDIDKSSIDTTEERLLKCLDLQ